MTNLSALRNRKMPDNSIHPDALCLEAANEIEKLQGEIARLRQHIKKLERRIHNQRVNLRMNWEIVEMRFGHKRMPEGVRSKMLEHWCETARKLRELTKDIEEQKAIRRVIENFVNSQEPL